MHHELYFKDSRVRLFMGYLIEYMENEWGRYHRYLNQKGSSMARLDALHQLAAYVSAVNFLLLSLFDKSTSISTVWDMRCYMLQYFPSISQYPAHNISHDVLAYMHYTQESPYLQHWFTIKCTMHEPMLGQVLKDLYTLYETPESAIQYFSHSHPNEIFPMARMPIYILSRINRNEVIQDIMDIHATLIRGKYPMQPYNRQSIPQGNYIGQTINPSGYLLNPQSLPNHLPTYQGRR